MDIGIFGSASTVDGITDQVRAAAGDGFGSFWCPQIFGPDAITALAVAGDRVDGIRLGTSVVPTWPRHPMMLAQQALTAAQATGGRFTLGIGLAHEVVVEAMWGLSFDKPLRHMREYLAVLMPLLQGEAAGFAGETLTGRGAIEVPADPPPVLVAALGPKMLELTGRQADGTITWMVGAATIADLTAPTINAAAEAAGRPPPEVVVALPVMVTDDVEAGRARAAEEFAVYGTLPSYRAMLDREGVAGPEDLAVVGNADEVATRLAAVVDAGATTFVASEFGRRDDRAATREALIALNGA
jgi:5,10-methylenetetrahydromethanopterin reductase